MVLLERHANHSSSTRLDDIPADDGIFSPVGALDEHVWLKSGDQVVRRFFVEHDHTVHGTQRLQNLRALRLRRDRPIRPLVDPHRPIGVDADEQRIPKAARLTEVPDMAGMEQIENAIRENDGVSGRAAIRNEANGLIERHASVLMRTLGENVHVCFGR